jgi:hypothetical protein
MIKISETDKTIILECLHIVMKVQPCSRYGADKKSSILRIIKNLEKRPQRDMTEETRFI